MLPNNTPLDPPNAPFASSSYPFSNPGSGQTSRDTSPGPFGYGGSGRNRDSGFNSLNSASNLSLSVNYLPHKFSSSLLTSPGGARRRKGGGKGGLDPVFPKTGGGVEAFKSGESRIPGAHDDDTGDLATSWFGGQTRKKKLRWNRFKWILFIANFVLTVYTLMGLITCLLTWFNVFQHADIVRVGNRPELVICTLAATTGLFTAAIGWAGILLNNRSFLAMYTFLTWITFALLVVPGYITYKKRTFNLEGKLNSQWSRVLGTAGRLRVQNELDCCGYFNPFVEATVSQTCYARSVLPGCKLYYMIFERRVLAKFYTFAFALVPVQIGVMVAGLLCSNHVTYRFGKGMMPKAYRLSLSSMAVIMDQYANQLAEQYGQDVANEILATSRAHLHLDSMPTMSYQSEQSTGPAGGGNTYYHAKYDSIGARVPETIS
ncbi:hypothetical protein AX17_003747 [Amanita inopinata Kibby_2008]|nr:hypothetical protein AX17_003747 [Amanita inopinata Kibby_2008]